MAALAALAYACTSEQRVVAPLSADVSVDEGGTYFLPSPDPPYNVTPTPQRNTRIFIPQGRVALVAVTGTLDFGANFAFKNCSGNAPQPLPDGEHIGPAGFSTVPFPFRVLVTRGDLGGPGSPIALAFGAPGASIAIGYEGGPGYLWAGRPAAWGFLCAGGPDHLPPTPEYIVSGGQFITADVLPLPTITANKTTVTAGDTVTFTLEPPAGEPIELTEGWHWAVDSGPGGGTVPVSGCHVEYTCRMKVGERGHPYMNGIVHHGVAVSAVGPTIAITKSQDVQIKIDTVYGPLDGGSFTARANENTITLKATVIPESLAAKIKWTVTVDPASFEGTRPPTGALTGAATSFQVDVPDNPQHRWPKDHPGDLIKKQLGYQIRASVVVDGKTYDSEMRALHQAERDVLREEYVELSVSLPNTRFPQVEDIGRQRTDNFSEDELNRGADYTVYWVQAILRTGIETVRSLLKRGWPRGETFPGLGVESAFRNPVHQEIHLLLSKTVDKRYHSNHEFGLAIDFRITGSVLSAEQLFYRLSVYAKDRRVGACFEPAASIIRSSETHTLDHAHLDWGIPCDGGW